MLMYACMEGEVGEERGSDGERREGVMGREERESDGGGGEERRQEGGEE